MPLSVFVLIVASIFLIGVFIEGISIWIYRATNACLHSYERIDGCNDKKMVLVCRKCGKIKKLRK